MQKKVLNKHLGLLWKLRRVSQLQLCYMEVLNRMINTLDTAIETVAREILTHVDVHSGSRSPLNQWCYRDRSGSQWCVSGTFEAHELR